MRKRSGWLKAAFLYIGSMVGAGFASGKEINFYFGDADVLTVILSAIVTGSACCLFLKIGSLDIRFGANVKKIVSALLAIGSVLIGGIMLASLRELTHSGVAVIITAVATASLTKESIEGAEKLCAIVVPFILIALATVCILKTGGTIEGEFLPQKSVEYAAMNLFFEFGLMYEEGKKLDAKGAVFAGVAVTMISAGLMLTMRYAIVDCDGSLPFVQAAGSVGVGLLAVIMMFGAVASTLVGNYRLTMDFLRFTPKTITSLIAVVLTISIACFDFSSLVNVFYPIIGILGFGVMLFSIIYLLKNKRSIYELRGSAKRLQ